MTRRPSRVETDRTVAAVDLGSNSFHLVVAERDGDAFRIVDRLKERVRLALGLRRRGRMDPKVGARAIACLERFAQRLHGLRPADVRAVGTNTFRQVKDGGAFLQACERALGRRIEIVSGDEEARLIYRGVAHDVAHGGAGGHDRRLVVDIGGGSTECVIGEGRDVLTECSLYMGCVSYTHRFFPRGRLSKSRMTEARTAARSELEPFVRPFAELGWQVAIGSSGTALEIGAMLVENAWCADGITADGLRRLRKVVQSARSLDTLDVPGLSGTRRPVIPGGVAILQAVFDAFGLAAMEISAASIREGIVLSLLGDPGTEDPRDATIEALQRRHGVDAEHARRVERTALALLERVGPAWFLDDAFDRRLLAWAARVHEIGMSVARSGYQRHSAYLVENGDLPGFSQGDQRVLAAIVRGHRRKLLPDAFADLPTETGRRALLLCVLLRIARRLNRSRSRRPPVPASVDASADGLTLTFRPGWLDEHPLTRYDLQEEAARLRSVALELRVT